MLYQSGYKTQPIGFRTRRGQFVAVRQATSADVFLMADLLGRLSDRTRQLRYMGLRHFSSEVIWNEATRITQGEAEEQVTLVATVRRGKSDEAVAMAELVRDQHDMTVGEIALIVRDDQQQQGIGSCLIAQLIPLAQRSGIATLTASMLAENQPMLRLIRGLALPYTATTRYGETQVVVSVPAYPSGSPLARRAYKLAA
jgi:acetyltransferase